MWLQYNETLKNKFTGVHYIDLFPRKTSLNESIEQNNMIFKR